MFKTYNLKVTQFGNGLVEVKRYSRVIGDGKVNETKSQLKEAQERGKRRAFNETHTTSYNPFTDSVECMELFGRDIDVFRKAHCERVSFNRTKQQIYNISRQCNWEYFITLTFDEVKVDRYDFEACMKKANDWFHYQRKHYAKDLQYLFVPEMHKDGAWHIHGLVAQIGNMDISWKGATVTKCQVNGRWYALKKPQKLLEVGGWKYGFSNATKVNDVQKVSSYIVKYITKELCAVTKGKKRYYRSQNIPKPLEDFYLLERGEYMNFVYVLADSIGSEVTYTKSVKGEYMNVDYIYLQSCEEREEKENE